MKPEEGAKISAAPADAALEAAENARLRMAVQGMPVMVDAFDEQRLIKVWNAECERVTGFSAEEVVGNPDALLLMYPDPDYRAKMIKEWTERGDNYRGWVWELTCKDGSKKAIEWSNVSAVLPIPGWATWGIGVDVTERTKLEAERETLIAELKQRNEELQRKREEMEGFMYAVSHDLMSPLVTIKSFAGFIRENLERQDLEKARADLEFIDRAGVKMESLLKELLELSRVGRIVRPPEVCPLDLLASEAAMLVGGRIAAAKVNLIIESMPFAIRGEKSRLVEVFQNLLDNGAKFIGSQSQPEIRLSAHLVPEGLQILVKDNGAGIDPEYAQKPFGMFEKVEPHSEGTGMGLTLVRRIVEFHGGSISFHSPGLGQGTTFSIIFPAQIVVPLQSDRA